VTSVWEAARGLYSIALVVALLLLARFAPAFIRAINRFTDSINNGAEALRGATMSADTLARMAAQIAEIHRATVKERNPPP
jgi:hypothetical protein